MIIVILSHEQIKNTLTHTGQTDIEVTEKYWSIFIPQILSSPKTACNKLPLLVTAWWQTILTAKIIKK